MVLLTRNLPASPFDTLWDMRREMDRMLDGVARLGVGDSAAWVLPTEVRETSEELRFDIELPGLRPEDIELTVENNVLTVAGEKKLERDEEKDEGEYRLFERRYGRFSRSFTIPQIVDANAINAKYDHGVLTVRLPKHEASRPRRIEIGGSENTRQIGSTK
jgi:HSP20 family protein